MQTENDVLEKQTSIWRRIKRLGLYIPYIDFWTSIYQQLIDGAQAWAEEKVEQFDSPTAYALQKRHRQRFIRIVVTTAVVMATAATLVGLTLAGILFISNPIGWAILGTAALIGLGYLTYKTTQGVQKAINRRNSRITVAEVANLKDKKLEQLIKSAKLTPGEAQILREAISNKNFAHDSGVLTEQEINDIFAGITSVDKKARLRHYLGFSREQLSKYCVIHGLDSANIPAIIKHSQDSNPLADQHGVIHTKRSTGYAKNILVGGILGGFVIVCMIFFGLTIFGVSLTGFGAPLAIGLAVAAGFTIGGMIGYDLARDQSTHPNVKNARLMDGIDDESDPARYKKNRYTRIALLSTFSAIGISLTANYSITGFLSSFFMRHKPTPPSVQLGNKIRVRLYKKLKKVEQQLIDEQKKELLENPQLKAQHKTALKDLRKEHQGILDKFATQHFDKHIAAAAKPIFAPAKEQWVDLLDKIQRNLFTADDMSKLQGQPTVFLNNYFSYQLTRVVKQDFLNKLLETSCNESFPLLKEALQEAIENNPAILYEIACSTWPELNSLRDAWRYGIQTNQSMEEIKKALSFIQVLYTETAGKQKLDIFQLKEEFTAEDLSAIAAFWKSYYQKQKTKLDKTRISDFIAHRLFYNIYFIYNEVLIKAGQRYFNSVIFEPIRLARNNPFGGAPIGTSIGAHIAMVGIILVRLAICGIPALIIGVLKTVIEGLLLLPVISKISNSVVEAYQAVQSFIQDFDDSHENKMSWPAKILLTIIGVPLGFIYKLSFVPTLIANFQQAQNENRQTYEKYGKSYSSFRLAATYASRYLFALIKTPIIYIMDLISINKNSMAEQKTRYQERKELAQANLAKIAACEKALKKEAQGVQLEKGQDSATLLQELRADLDTYTTRKERKFQARIEKETHAGDAAPEPQSDPNWNQYFLGKVTDKPEGAKPHFLPSPPHSHLLKGLT